MDDTAHGITTGSVTWRLPHHRALLGAAVRDRSRPLRTEGRHRRWSDADLAALEEMRRLTTAAGGLPAGAARVARAARETVPGRSPSVSPGPPCASTGPAWTPPSPRPWPRTVS
ncbi:hypothetical protein [Streptomyces sp. NPDC056144]|uniref:hypothetical protein n=1 Tax=unclassified Streptomyces TaxID=2593676 RepID=UPI0035D62D39